MSRDEERRLPRHRVLDPRPVLVVRVAPAEWSWAMVPLAAAVDSLRHRGVRVIMDVREAGPGEEGRDRFTAIPNDPGDARVRRAVDDWTLAIDAIFRFLEAVESAAMSVNDAPKYN